MLTGEVGAVDARRGAARGDQAHGLRRPPGARRRRARRYVRSCDLLHRHGVAGATVLLGVDGTAHGARQRARFFGRNAEVPMMIIAVGDGERIAAVLPELGALLARPLVTLERVRVCKRDGERLAEPRAPARDRRVRARAVAEADGLRVASRRAHDGRRCTRSSCGGCARPAPPARRRCAASGATTATTRRTATRFWQLRRRVPVVTVDHRHPGTDRARGSRSSTSSPTRPGS